MVRYIFMVQPSSVVAYCHDTLKGSNWLSMKVINCRLLSTCYQRCLMSSVSISCFPSGGFIRRLYDINSRFYDNICIRVKWNCRCSAISSNVISQLFWSVLCIVSFFMGQSCTINHEYGHSGRFENLILRIHYVVFVWMPKIAARITKTVLKMTKIDLILAKNPSIIPTLHVHEACIKSTANKSQIQLHYRSWIRWGMQSRTLNSTVKCCKLLTNLLRRCHFYVASTT